MQSFSRGVVQAILSTRDVEIQRHEPFGYTLTRVYDPCNKACVHIWYDAETRDASGLKMSGTGFFIYGKEKTDYIACEWGVTSIRPEEVKQELRRILQSRVFPPEYAKYFGPVVASLIHVKEWTVQTVYDEPTILLQHDDGSLRCRFELKLLQCPFGHVTLHVSHFTGDMEHPRESVFKVKMENILMHLSYAISMYQHGEPVTWNEREDDDYTRATSNGSG